MITSPPILPIPVPNADTPGVQTAKNPAGEESAFAQTLAQIQSQTPSDAGTPTTENPQPTPRGGFPGTPEGSNQEPAPETPGAPEAKAALETEAESSTTTLSLIAAMTLPAIPLPTRPLSLPVIEQADTETVMPLTENAPERRAAADLPVSRETKVVATSTRSALTAEERALTASSITTSSATTPDVRVTTVPVTSMPVASAPDTIPLVTTVPNIPVSAEKVATPMTLVTPSTQQPLLQTSSSEILDAPVDSHVKPVAFTPGAGIVSSPTPSVSASFTVASFVPVAQFVPGAQSVTPTLATSGPSIPAVPPIAPLAQPQAAATPVAQGEVAPTTVLATPEQAIATDKPTIPFPSGEGAKAVRLETLDRWFTVGAPTVQTSGTVLPETALPQPAQTAVNLPTVSLPAVTTSEVAITKEVAITNVSAPAVLPAADLPTVIDLPETPPTPQGPAAPTTQTISLPVTSRPNADRANQETASAPAGAEPPVNASPEPFVANLPANRTAIQPAPGNVPMILTGTPNLAAQNVALTTAQTGTQITNSGLEKSAATSVNAAPLAISLAAEKANAAAQQGASDTNAQTQEESNPSNTPDFEIALPKVETSAPSSEKQNVSAEAAVSPVTHRAAPTAETANVARTVHTGLSAERLSVVEQVSRHLETMRLTSGHGEISLQLHPDTLGSVHVTLSTKPAGVVAVIVAETVQAQQAMESAKEHLRAALENRGLRLNTLDVQVGQQSMSGSNFGFAGRSDTPQERSAYAYGRMRSASVADSPEAIAPVAAASHIQTLRSNSRLDYRA